MGEQEGNTPADEQDPYFTPVIQLPKLEFSTLEEDENVSFKARAKLYRYDKNEDPPEWKERGVGEVKILQHNTHGRVRVLMRRDKTLKLCANHYIQKYMKLDTQENSDRAFIWRVIHEYADGEPSDETLAIRFKTSEIANEFRSKFEEAASKLEDLFEEYQSDKTAENDVASKNQENDPDQIVTKDSKGEEVCTNSFLSNNSTAESNDKDSMTNTKIDDSIEATGENIESVITELKTLNVEENTANPAANTKENSAKQT